MPKYFFHIRGPTKFFEDDEGIDLPDLAAAREEAIAAASEILRNAILTHASVSDKVIEITDEAGRVLVAYAVKDAAKLL